MTRRAYFMNFVDRVLLHLDNSKIHSFYLSCDNYADASRVSTWISAVMKRQVQKLDIKYRKQDFVVPRCVFGSNSLRELNLAAKCIIKVSASCFSRLEILNISGVTFMNQCFPNTQEITMTFPVLKVLTLCSTKLLNVKVVNLNVPALHSFQLSTYEDGWVPDDSHGLLIKICGQNLKQFNYFTDCPENYVLDCASSVTEANISIYIGCRKYNSQHMTTVGLRACNILKMFLGVVNLTISSQTIEVLHPLENLQALLPSYNNLVQLKVSSGKVIDGTIMALLHNSPVLETLILDKSYDLQFDKDAVQERVPQCFMSHLKVVELRQFNGNKHELDLAEFLLINAMVLEVMIITACQIPKWQAKTLLSTFPKGSSHAKILFS
ncbi:hypothetical protein Vadar_007333 [Vaccinium darrowii]|uniref:Uncharacterized protein n=1 Tax=Vaccinium darrowii TaxID=229202 RepID=A0ACB7ZB03_9ERIC|nr:hypothetical protein Vadar_007333 [Vaccinium darrowii]